MFIVLNVAAVAATEAATAVRPTSDNPAKPLKPANTGTIALPNEIKNATIFIAIKTLNPVITASIFSFKKTKKFATPLTACASVVPKPIAILSIDSALSTKNLSKSPNCLLVLKKNQHLTKLF